MSASSHENPNNGKRTPQAVAGQQSGEKRLQSSSAQSTYSSSTELSSGGSDFNRYQRLLRENFPNYYEGFNDPEDYIRIYDAVIEAIFKSFAPISATLLNQLCTRDSGADVMVDQTQLKSLAASIVALLTREKWSEEDKSLYYFISKRAHVILQEAMYQVIVENDNSKYVKQACDVLFNNDLDHIDLTSITEVNGKRLALLAAIVGRASMVLACLNHYPNLRFDNYISPDDEKRSILHLAAMFDNLSVTHTLLNNGASAEVLDSQGRTPLHAAAARGHHEIVEALLNKGAEVDAIDEEYTTPLYLAIQWGHAEAALALIASNADMYFQYLFGSGGGYNAMELAIEEKKFHLIPLLLREGCYFCAVTCYGASSGILTDFFVNTIECDDTVSEGLRNEIIDALDDNTSLLSHSELFTSFDTVQEKISMLVKFLEPHMIEDKRGQKILSPAASNWVKGLRVFVQSRDNNNRNDYFGLENYLLTSVRNYLEEKSYKNKIKELEAQVRVLQTQLTHRSVIEQEELQGNESSSSAPPPFFTRRSSSL